MLYYYPYYSCFVHFFCTTIPTSTYVKYVSPYIGAFFLTENARVEQAAAVDRFVSSFGKRSHESIVGIGISGTFLCCTDAVLSPNLQSKLCVVVMLWSSYSKSRKFIFFS